MSFLQSLRMDDEIYNNKTPSPPSNIFHDPHKLLLLLNLSDGDGLHLPATVILLRVLAVVSSRCSTCGVFRTCWVGASIHGWGRKWPFCLFHVRVTMTVTKRIYVQMASAPQDIQIIPTSAVQRVSSAPKIASVAFLEISSRPSHPTLSKRTQKYGM